MGLTIFHKIFPTLGLNMGNTLCNVVNPIELNNVMHVIECFLVVLVTCSGTSLVAFIFTLLNPCACL